MEEREARGLTEFGQFLQETGKPVRPDWHGGLKAAQAVRLTDPGLPEDQRRVLEEELSGR